LLILYQQSSWLVDVTQGWFTSNNSGTEDEARQLVATHSLLGHNASGKGFFWVSFQLSGGNAQGMGYGGCKFETRFAAVLLLDKWILYSGTDLDTCSDLGEAYASAASGVLAQEDSLWNCIRTRHAIDNWWGNLEQALWPLC